MKDWFDREQLVCFGCKHRWILVSNKKITQDQHELWIKNFWKQHAQIKKEKENK